jgi:myo-inositol-1-phosphate synthase
VVQPVQEKAGRQAVIAIAADAIAAAAAAESKTFINLKPSFNATDRRKWNEMKKDKLFPYLHFII